MPAESLQLRPGAGDADRAQRLADVRRSHRFFLRAAAFRGHRGPREIADREHTDEFTVGVDHGKTTDLMRTHHLLRFFYVVLCPAAPEPPAHGARHVDLSERLPLCERRHADVPVGQHRDRAALLVHHRARRRSPSPTSPSRSDRRCRTGGRLPRPSSSDLRLS